MPAPWLGIPTPAFGLDEVAGPYTHYVHRNIAGARDDLINGSGLNDNPGTPALPRLTVPRNLPAGAVVEIRGGPYTASDMSFPQWEGTAAAPVFIRGIDTGAGKPRFSNTITFYDDSAPFIGAVYTIVEGLSFYEVDIFQPCHHFVMRDCELTGDLVTGGMSIASYVPATPVTHVVILRCNIHDNGDVASAVDQDKHGIAVSQYVNNVWILDNEFSYNSGDGVQVEGGTTGQTNTHHIYVAGNESHHNKQTGLWCKHASDVIMSQNVCHDHKPVGAAPTAWGGGLGYQYNPERLWFLFNRVYNCCYGIYGRSGDGVGTGQNVYVLGNVFHDIQADPVFPYPPAEIDPLNPESPAAISMVGIPNKHIVSNTMVNCRAGIYVKSAANLVVDSNVIANITDAACQHLLLQTVSAGVKLFERCLVAQGGGPGRYYWGGAYSGLAALFADTGLGATCQEAAAAGFVGAADFHLLGSSPARDLGIAGTTPPEADVYGAFAAAAYGVTIEVDFDGLARPDAATAAAEWDAGAYEFGAETGGGGGNGDGEWPEHLRGQAVQRGEGGKIAYTPPANVVAGQVIVLAGALVSYATQDIPANKPGSVQLPQWADFVKETGAIQLGAIVYWNPVGSPVGGTPTTGAATASATGAFAFGRCVAAAAANAETVAVRGFYG